MERIENYTARYVKTDAGYLAQLIEWPEVVTEGKDLDDARESLRDALNEMMLAYRELNRELPKGSALFETLSVVVS